MSDNEIPTFKVTPAWKGLGRVPKWVDDYPPAPFTELTELESASFHGRIEIIKSLLEADVDINARNPLWKTTPLMAATSGGSTAAVQFLINNGADLEAKDLVGRSSLFTAVDFRHKEVMQILLDEGANVNTSDDWGVTLLMGAVLYNSIETVKVLLLAGADVNATDEKGNTAFDYVRYKRYSIPIIGDFFTKERNKEMIQLLEKARSRAV